MTKLGLLATLAGSSAFAMTLMACYGCPDGECGPVDYPDASERDARDPDARVARPTLDDASTTRDASTTDGAADGAPADAGEDDAADAGPDGA